MLHDPFFILRGAAASAFQRRYGATGGAAELPIESRLNCEHFEPLDLPRRLGHASELYLGRTVKSSGRTLQRGLYQWRNVHFAVRHLNSARLARRSFDVQPCISELRRPRVLGNKPLG